METYSFKTNLTLTGYDVLFKKTETHLKMEYFCNGFRESSRV